MDKERLNNPQKIDVLSGTRTHVISDELIPLLDKEIDPNQLILPNDLESTQHVGEQCVIEYQKWFEEAWTFYDVRKVMFAPSLRNS